MAEAKAGSCQKAQKTRKNHIVVAYYRCFLLHSSRICSRIAFNAPLASQQADNHRCSGRLSMRPATFPSATSNGCSHPASPIITIFATQPEIWYDGSTYWWTSARSESISTKAGLAEYAC